MSPTSPRSKSTSVGTHDDDLPSGARPVRWIVLLTGRKATEDYQPAASEGESTALVREVTELCVALHPHSEIRLFPASGEAMLFWRSRQGAREWIVTRVATAPNPDGLRTALEYVSIVLTEEDFLQVLNGDPFVARSSGLMDRIRERFLSGSTEPLYAEPLIAGAATASAESAASPKAPVLSEDRAATDENLQAIEAFYASSAGKSPAARPTFAAWWSSTGSVPEGYFDIVLRAVANKPLALREAVDLTAELAGSVKTDLPRSIGNDAAADALSRSIVASADAMHREVSVAAGHLNVETPAQFLAHLNDAAQRASQLGADLLSLQQRLGSALSVAESARLVERAAQAAALARDLPRVRHPNPFSRPSDASRAASPSRTAQSFATAGATRAVGPKDGKTPGVDSRIAIGAGVVVIALVGMVWVAAHHGASPPAPSAAPTPVAVAAKATAAPTPNPTIAPPAVPIHPTLTAASILTTAADVVEPVAKANATRIAHSATASSVDVSDKDAIDKIAADAITAAYKSELSTAQVKTVYGAGKAWNYAHYAAAVPTLAFTVHEAVTVALVESKAAKQVSAAQAEAARKASVTPPKSKAETAPSASRPHAALPHHPDASESESSKTAEKKHGSADQGSSHASASQHAAAHTEPKPAPKTGSAAQAGL